VVLLVGAVAVDAWTFGPHLRASSQAAVNAQAPDDEVDLTVRVSPTSARIFLDDTPIATGAYKGKLSNDGRGHRIRAEAPGFVPMEQSVTPTGALIISLALAREPASAP